MYRKFNLNYNNNNKKKKNTYINMLVYPQVQKHKTTVSIYIF